MSTSDLFSAIRPSNYPPRDEWHSPPKISRSGTPSPSPNPFTLLNIHQNQLLSLICTAHSQTFSHNPVELGSTTSCSSASSFSSITSICHHSRRDFDLEDNESFHSNPPLQSNSQFVRHPLAPSPSEVVLSIFMPYAHLILLITMTIKNC